MKIINNTILSSLFITTAFSFVFGQDLINHPDLKQYKEDLNTYNNQAYSWTELYRPQFHFTPFKYWQNDPNGLVYYKGKWHFFFQHDIGGNAGLSWGHATSTDLLHWQHLPPAIPQDSLGKIYSGSGVIDWNNTSGFFNDKPGYVAIYTYHQPQNGWQSQAIAYSPDLKHFYKYKGNPVIPELRDIVGQKQDKDFRDPKVFWHEQTQKWIMVVAGGTVRIFSSPNLKDWTFESINEDIRTECPDLFEMAVEGQPDEKYWVMTRSGQWAEIGDFDGHVFTPKFPVQKMNVGPDFLAMQSFSNAPNNRRVANAWCYSWGYAGKWIGLNSRTQSVMLELSLTKNKEGIPILRQLPVKELQNLRGAHWEYNNLVVNNDEIDLDRVKGKELEIIAEFEVGTNVEEVGFTIAKGKGEQGTRVGYSIKNKAFFLDRSKSGWDQVGNMEAVWEIPANLNNRRVKMRVLLDRQLVELFGEEGVKNITAWVLPQPASDGVSAFSKGGTSKLISLDVYEMKSIHPKTKGKIPTRIDIWKEKHLVSGRKYWLSARAYPKNNAKLRWKSSNDSVLRIVKNEGDWVLVEPQKGGEVKLTAGLDENIQGTCNITVLENTFRSNIRFLYDSKGWKHTKHGMTHFGRLSQNHGAIKLRNQKLSVDLRLENSDAVGGLIARTTGKGSNGVVFELRAADNLVVYGQRNVNNSEGVTVLQTVDAKIETNKIFHLELTYLDKEKELQCALDGEEMFRIKNSPVSWDYSFGVTAEGTASFQNFKAVDFK
ncbi:glycoside hydrolase family 32 protein [Joostella atrarenae]|uniref:Glycoside hydrolase family 32 protein n=1 Tax=Joostella atrarenae TaxID=679257 RepID=A0ABS9J2N7_9FLAO|nr:glycoside hydrolase family 32 protein [Joostella atrarenae]MCF8714699.1 glycoside hydrolase family 32 protein [Joostella atrarenae]